MRRQDEVLCKNVFGTHLLHCAKQADVSWMDVKPECETPDLILDYLGTTYAVEVTSLAEQAPTDLLEFRPVPDPRP